MILVWIFLLGVQCIDALNCDFELDTCNWRPTRGLWKRKMTGEYSSTGPESDHTTGKGVFLMTSFAREPSVQTAILRSTYIRKNDTCLTFWYHMYGFEVNTLTVYKKEQGRVRQKLFEVVGNQGNQWLKAAIDSGSGYFSLRIIATLVSGVGYTNIAIDDINFSSGVDCQKEVTEIIKPVFDCDFEEDLCYWASPHRSDYGVRSVTEIPPAERTPTTYRHGSNGTSFVTLKSVSSYQQQSVLISPAIPIGQGGVCLSFWWKYQREYNEIESFSIKKAHIGTPFERTLQGEILYEPTLTRRYGSFNLLYGSWKKGQVLLPPGNDYFIFFHVLFRRWTEPSSTSYIEIDDISLNEGGPCKLEPQQEIVDCNFEKDNCHWFSKESQWTRHTGPSPTAFTGPPGDHTTGDGYYLLFQGLPMQGTSTIQTSPFQITSEGACLSFWYYMYGEDMKRATLVLNHRDGLETLWHLTDNQGEQWIQHNVSITITGEVNLVFSAKKGYFPRADIAIDDISISFEGICEKDMEETTTEPTTTNVTRSTVEVSKWAASPVLTINGDTKPARLKSRVEIICGEELEGATYTWLIKEEDGFNVMQEETNRTLIYDDIRLHHEGTYMCSVARDGYLDAESKTFDIEVVLPHLPTPSITVVGMENPVYTDSSVQLICQDPNNETDLSYDWRQFHVDSMTKLSETSRILEFDEIQMENAGNYSCTISKDDFLSAESEMADITVVEDPRPSPWLYHNIEENPAQAGRQVQFKCGSDDVEGGVFHWKTNSSAFATSPPPNSRILTIKASDTSHNGQYSCRISKDGYFTAKSRIVTLNVVPGRRCASRYSCWGDAHSGKCINNRCQCSKKAVFQGNKCAERPRAPTISVSPDYKHFDIGETFYVICEVREKVAKSLTYTFKRTYSVIDREGERDSYYIHKVANASSFASGSYSCAITSNGISSEYSNAIYLTIREFHDLNCDFDNQDTCLWSQVNEPLAINFTMIEKQSRKIPKVNWYLQLSPYTDDQISKTFLRTPKLQSSKQDACLSFRYRMHGPGVYSLAVWKYTSLWGDTPERSNLWTAIGDKGDKWNRKKLIIKAGSGLFYLQFEAFGNVALDDIEYKYRTKCSSFY